MNSSREFRINGVFFSLTDRRGFIEACNDVFVRISGYTTAELTGQPHNIIRHPDMPRSVFQLFWDYLRDGQPVAAYVKNLAADGRYYWVLALAGPVGDRLLSIRFKPSSALHPLIEAVYQEMRATEQASEAGGADRAEAMKAGRAKLEGALRAHGFADYETFMRTALLREEINSRDSVLSGEGGELLPSLGEAADDFSQGLRPAYEAGRGRHAQLRTWSSRLDEFARLNRALCEKAGKMRAFAGEFRLMALNANLMASRLGQEGRGVDVIVGHLSRSAQDVAGQVRQLGGRVESGSRQLGKVIFDLSWARVQYEMVMVHYREVIGRMAGGQILGTEVVAGSHLASAFRLTTEQALTALGELESELAGLDQHVEVLQRTITALQMAYVSCKVEISRVSRGGVLTEVFGEIGVHVERTRNVLSEMIEDTLRIEAETREAAALRQPVTALSDQLAADGEVLEQAVAKAQLQRPRDAQVVVVETSEAAADEAPPRPEMTGEDTELMRSVSEVS